MDWEKVGREAPIEDENGDRPELDKDGNARDVELIPYEPLDNIQLKVNTFASRKDRRFLQATMDNLGRDKPSSVQYAEDFNRTLDIILGRFVKAVKTEDAEYEGRKAAEYLSDELGYADATVLLLWLYRKSSLAEEKKSN